MQYKGKSFGLLFQTDCCLEVSYVEIHALLLDVCF